MLNLGELYYFDKLLDENKDNIRELSLYGVEYNLDWDRYSNLELINKYKDTFVESYSLELKANNFFALNTAWNKITDININSSTINSILGGVSGDVAEMLIAVNEWLENGQDIDQLELLLKEFVITSSNSFEGFVLYYGLRVLAYLSNLLIKLQGLESESEKIVSDRYFNDLEKFDIKKIETMVAVCPATLSGLFNTNGIEIINSGMSIEEIISKIEGKILHDKNLKLVITMDLDQSYFDKLVRHFNSKLLISPIPQPSKEAKNTNFFADLALKTLGLPESLLKQASK